MRLGCFRNNWGMRISLPNNLPKWLPASLLVSSSTPRSFTSKDNNSLSVFQENTLVKTQTQLTSFAESTPEGLASVGHSDALHAMGNPYPDPDLRKVLSRKYQIATFTWADTDLATNTALLDLDIMSALLSIPNIADKLTQFRWLRADVDIEVRLNATPFHIGALMVSYLPRCEVTVAADRMMTTLNSTLSQRSQNHGMIMSASTKNNLTIHIDREAATVFDPIDEAAIYAGALGVLSFTVLNPLVNAGGGSLNPIDVSVFASFSEPKVSGYGYFPILNPPARIVPHSMEVSTEALSRAAGAIIGPEAGKLFSPAIVTSAIDALGSAVSAVAPVAQFAASLGLSKPTNQSTAIPALIDDFRDMNYSHGVNQSTKLALHPNAGVGQVSMNGLKKNSLREFISKPMFYKTLTIDSASLTDTSLDTILVHPCLCAFESNIFTPTPLAYASQAFECYRGGMKFRYEFITSQFVTARFRITHWPAPTLPPSIENYAGDAVSMVVDVRGDTVAEFTAPYISPYPYQPTLGYFHCENPAGYALMPIEYQNSFVTISLINAMQQPDFAGSAVIYVNIYVSAAEDFVFGRSVWPSVRTPLSQAPTPDSKIEPHSLTLSFTKPFPPIVPASGTYEAGLVLPEQFTGIEELCMRYGPLYNTATQADELVPVIAQYDTRDLTLNSEEDALSFWGKCFRWNRGGLRYKLLLPESIEVASVDTPFRYAAAAIVDTTPHLVAASMYGIFVQDNTLRSVCEFEWPWPLTSYANSYYAELAQDLHVNTTAARAHVGVLDPGSAQNESIPITFAWRAAADDFMFGHQLAVPIQAYVPPSPPPAKAKGKQKVSVPRSGKIEQPKLPELDQSFGLPEAVREKLAKYLLLKESKTSAQ